jgi:riboflavin kinase/FMN adenylyltransferase
MKIIGRVVDGNKVGRTLGYPTANIAVDGPASVALENAADGVYAARVSHDGRCWNAMANLGIKPTFPGSERILELHILDFEGDLYGEELEVELVEFIRPERRFASSEALRTQIAQDKLKIETTLRHQK